MQDYMVQQAYFGKVPCRGDFIRSTQLPELTQTLDKWLTRTMQQLTIDPHWKTVYDQMPVINFLITGNASSHVIPGIILRSMDTSGRRFPFVRVGIFENTAQPVDMAALLPMHATYWKQLHQGSAFLFAEYTQEPALEVLEQEIGSSSFTALHKTAQQDWQEYLSHTTLEMLQRQLFKHDVRQCMMATGLLLQPLLTTDISALNRGMRFPLPQDASIRPLFAAFWLALVDVFLNKQQYESTAFVMETAGEAELLLVFSSGDPNILASVIDPRNRMEIFVDLAQSAWVDEHIANDYGLKKLSNYLLQPQLALHQALRSFRDTFSG